MIHVLLLCFSLAQSGGQLSLTAGEQKVMSIGKIRRVAIGNASIADVKTIDDDKVLLIGNGEGHTTLQVWKSDGTRASYLVSVNGHTRQRRP